MALVDAWACTAVIASGRATADGRPFIFKNRDASVNARRRKKTFDGFERLPEEFTIEDIMRCFEIPNVATARTRAFRLIKDNLAIKIGEYADNGTAKSKYRKTGVNMM